MIRSIATAACAAAAMAVLALAPARAAAVETKNYSDSTRQEFASGQFENTCLDERGRLVLGPAMTTLMSGVDYAWCAAVAPDGADYVGTVPEGAVYRIADGKSAALFQTGQAGVFSIAVLGSGAVVAGTGPEGKVFRITPDGSGEVIADLEAPYVFGLAVEPSGAIVAATGGGSGNLYRIADEGEPALVYQSPSAHLLSVALGGDGGIYASSGDRGAIYRVDPAGAVSVIFSAPQRVVHDIAVGDDGSVYAVTAALSDEKAASDDDAVKSIINELKNSQREGASSSTASQSPQRSYQASNVLYRILPSGEARPLMNIGASVILSVLPQADRVLCGTAGRSGIFAVRLDGSQGTRIFDAEGRQVLDLAAHPHGGFVAAFGMPGGAARFQSGVSRTGAFTSRVLKADGLTRWGDFSWLGDAPAGTRVAFKVRCGNTPAVDRTWTDWAAVDAASGSGATALPPSAFVQYRAEFATASESLTPAVSFASFSGLPINLPPSVTNLNAKRSTNGEDKEPQKRDPAAALSGAVNITWKGEDPNGDTLAYEIAFREARMPRFLVIKDEVTEQRFRWDATSVPDGLYYFRVTATDRPSNAGGTELAADAVEGPFVVDNTPPVFSNLSISDDGGAMTVTVDVADAASAIESASFSVDGGRWEALVPDDGIFDSRAERLTVRIDKAGAAVVVIRAVDRAGNAAATMALLEESDR